MKVEILISCKNLEELNYNLKFLEKTSLNAAHTFFKIHPKEKEFIQVISGDNYFIDFKITK